ncbi:MAG: L-rhamnose isomerase, partial [Clostridia bacterium]|nr:L-rhamnose isomerase [Clostridia bacterium]
TMGFRSWQKALLNAMCLPNKQLKELQDAGKFTELFVKQEEAKLLPFADVWEHYCEVCGVKAGSEWFDEVQAYEKEVLSKRG